MKDKPFPPLKLMPGKQSALANPPSLDEYDKMPVTGNCDAGCGKPATTWFGRTSCATCGDSACVNVLQDSYDREGERPDFGPCCVPDHPEIQRRNDWQAERIAEQAKQANRYHDRIRNLEAALETQHGWNAKQAARIVELKQHAQKDAACIARLQAAVRENHEWHQAYTDIDGYIGSGLEQTNRTALSLPEYQDPGQPVMTDDELDAVRTEMLQQLYDALEKVATTSEDGANFLMGVCYGTLRRLLRGLMGPAEVAELAEQVHAEFTKHWPQLNPEYFVLLVQLYAEKDTPQ